MEEIKKNTYIVITSVFYPTEAIYAFSKKTGYNLIVIGDKKTPVDWNCPDVDYISLNEQECLDYNLVKILPYNHYSRKMIGYLKAIENGAEFIIDTDDDNIPKKNWNFPDLDNVYDNVHDNKGFVNIYKFFTKQKIWPRGLPLGKINSELDVKKIVSEKTSKIGVWQGLADEDPDVDAIYRLTNDTPCYFEERHPVVLGKGTVCPFNTQNTLIRKDLFALLYLPVFVTFRFTDILRGLVAQPIMWLYDYQLGFTKATVVQKRNPHDYMKDFILEIPMYQYCEKVIELVSRSISKNESIDTNLIHAYESLLKEDIICDKEIMSLKTWLSDLKKINY